MADDWDDETVVATDVVPASLDGAKQARLVVLAGSNVGAVYAVKDTVIVGRGRKADVRTLGDGISRQHVRFRATREGVVLEDLGSTNGTFVNGEKVDSHLLEDGDKVHLGTSTVLKFTYQDALEEGFQRQMFESASRDALTGIYNKRLFLERLKSEFAFAQRHGAPLSLILFDLDHFKQVNDTYGHLAGDRVLSMVAAAVEPIIRSEDVFARYGGEEFAVLSRSTDPPSAAVVAERIRALVEGSAFVFEGVPIAVTVSVGLSAMPNSQIHSLEDLIARADAALYAAKNAGRNRVVEAAV